METIKLYYFTDEGAISYTEEFCLSSWYCKPAILCSLAAYKKCVFLICSKYGCRQFVPKCSKTYPISFVGYSKWFKNLNRIFVEFGDLVNYDSSSCK